MIRFQGSEVEGVKGKSRGARRVGVRLLSTAQPVLLSTLLLAGCLPSSGRQNDRSMVPSDSASIALAETVPVDTLQLGWEAAARPDDPMPLPTSIAWAGEGDRARIVVVETKEASIRLFTPSGRQARHIATGGGAESYPYLAGATADTAVVLERGLNRLAFVPLDSSGAVRHVPVPDSASTALVTEAGAFVRTGGGPEGRPGVLTRLDLGGRVLGRHTMRGQPWRASGFVKPWGDRVLALSGYRPVIDVWVPGAGPRLDTLALQGFSSPELGRSAQFMRGDAEQPPLLTSSAAALGERLFVVNMRGDHVRIDVYSAAGRLERVLLSPQPWAPLPYIPIDVAVRQTDVGVEFAVLLQRPSGFLQSADSRLVLYRWSGGAGTQAAAL